MKKASILLGALFLSAVLFGQSPENGLLFHSSFNKFSTNPDYSANPKTEVTGIPPELQMRMYQGPGEKDNAVLLNNKEFIGYTTLDNFNPKHGTVSLWLKPLNWKMSDNRYFQTFFEIRTGDGKYRFILNKDNTGDRLMVQITANGKYHYLTCKTNWQPGEWHKVDFTWNSSGMKLYVDGRPPVPGSGQEQIFKEDPGFPETIRWSPMWLNYPRGWRVNPEWSTSYDDLKVYDRVLSPSEILAAYEKYLPSKTVVRKPLATAPATLPIACPIPENNLNENFFATVKVAYDANTLILDFNVPTPGGKYSITTRDGELWTNDAVEFHVIGGDGRQRQFIVNPAGALYDSLQDDPKWNSHAKVSAERLGKNWTAHLEIPLADLGGGKTFQANFGASNPEIQHNAYTWSALHGHTGFADKNYFGTLVLGDKSEEVALTSLGDLRAGNLDIQYEAAPGIKVETEFASLSGVAGKGPKATLPTGKADISMKAATPAGKNVYTFYRTVNVNPPLTMNCVAYPTQDRLECRLDFNASGLKKASGTATLKSTKDGKVYAEKTFLADNPEFTVDLPLPKNLPDNSLYKVAVAVGNFSAEQNFRIPDMTPFRTRVAVDHTVPSPWKPVQISGRNVIVLDRVYSFDNGPLPSQIVSRGQKLFLTPPEFVLNGKPIVWGNVKFDKNYGDYAELSADGTFEGGTASVKGEVWFDGMFKFDMSLSPAAPLRIRSLTLGWSTPRDLALYCMSTAWTPWKNDEIRLKWDPREYHSLFWLSGTENGLAWWCQSDANWIIDPNRDNILVKRDSNAARITIDLFAAPATLAKPASYTMVFQGTPPKRPDLSLREVTQGPRWYNPDFAEVGGFSGTERLTDENIRHWISLVPIDGAKFRDAMAALHKKGFKTRLYGMPLHTSSLEDEYDYFFKTCSIHPSVIWNATEETTGKKYIVEPCCGNTPIADLHAWRLDKLYRETPELDGLYFDIMHVKDCDNPLHGCGGVDSFGKKYSSSVALNLRSYVLRVLKIHQKYNRQFGLHAHSAFFPFVHDLGDYWMPGEELFYDIERNPEWGYLEAVSPEAYQSAWNNTVRGIFLRGESQLCRIDRILQPPKLRSEALRSDEYAIHALAPAVLYDYQMAAFGIESPMLFRFWKIRKDIQLASADYHGYWIDPAAAPSVPAVKVSWYSWRKDSGAPYRAMLCAVNTSRPKVQFALNPDWKKLGGRPSEIVDLWSGKKLSEDDLTRLELNGHNFLMLGIR